MWQHAEGRCADLKGTKGFALPGATRHYAPDRQATVSHLRIELWLDGASRSIRGRVRLSLEALTTTARLELDAQELAVGAVLGEGGVALVHELDDGRLTVQLPRALQPGEPYALEVEYTGEPRRGLYFIGPTAFDPDRPPEVWTQGQDEDSRHWFPCFDYPNQKATTELIAHVGPGLFALSNGVLVASRALEGEHLWHYRQDTPHTTYLVSLVVGAYVALEHAGAEVPVVSYVHPRHEEEGRLTFRRTAEMVALFSSKIGIQYPYPRYAQICVADFIFGGMENTSATTLTDQILFDARAEPDHRGVAESLVAHELAHQWWGDLVTCADWSHAWLNEGFATYFEIVWREHAEGPAEADYARLLDLEAYFAEGYRRPLVERTYEEPIDLFDRHQYEKGSAVLHLLRFVLGEQDFWRALRRYGQSNGGRLVESADLRRAILEVTGRNLEALFDQWVHGAGHLQVTLTGSWDAEESTYNLVVEQTQKGERVPETFTVPVDVEVVTEEGSRTHRVRLDHRKQTVRLAAPRRPLYVVFDAGGHLPKQVDNRLATQMLRALVERSTDVHAVIGALRTLAKRGEPASVRAVAAALRSHRVAGVRAEAAKALRRSPSEHALEALSRAAAEDGDPRVRRAALRALGGRRAQGEALTDLLARRAAEESSDYAAADALRSIAELRTPRARALLDEGLRRTGHNHAIRVGALEGYAKLRDVTALDLVLAHTGDREHPRVREAAVTTLGALARHTAEHSLARTTARDTLVELLSDPWLRVRIRAAEALKLLHARSALGELRDQAERELDGRARRAMKLAERELRETAAGAEELERLRDELRTLELSYGKLTDRLEKVEARGSRTTGGDAPRPPAARKRGRRRKKAAE